MTREEMKIEMEKLNKSQRDSMRQLPIGNLDHLQVSQSGWTTLVKCESNGFRFIVKLGPKGKKISSEFFEIN